MKLLIDTLGGDNAPAAVLDGCLKAYKERNDLELVLVGKKDDILAALKKYKIEESKVEIIEAKEAILNTDHPATFFKDKPEATLSKAFEALRTREDIDALVSAGPTGALLTGGVLRIGRIPGVARPALLATFPNQKGGLTRVIDSGANMDCKPEYLLQFAQMASAYLEMIDGKKPRIGLLNVGTEEGKGNELTKAAFPLLKESGLNFVGNIEADHAFLDEADVIVTDGFAGNVLVKTMEGTAHFVSGLFKNALMGSFIAKIGALFQLKRLKEAKKPLEYSKKVCAPLLGTKKLIIKIHGKAKEDAFYVSINEACKLVEGKLLDKIQAQVQ